MKFKHLFSVLALSLALPVAAGAPAFAAGAPVTMRMASPYPSTIPQTELEQWWIKQIEDKSSGAIKIKPFWAGEAGAAEEIPNLVSSGSIDIGTAVQGAFPSLFPLFGAPNTLPFSFKTIEQASKVQTEILSVPAVQAELKRDNIKPLWQHVLNPYRLLCTMPISKMADFKGVRIRSYGVYQPIMWKALGAVPVNVQATEVYEGLQRGRIDCAYFSEDLFVQWKLYEVAKYVSGANFGPMSGWSVFMNRARYEGLSPEDKRIVDDASAQASAREIVLMNEQAELARKTLLAKGVQYTNFTDMATLEKTLPNFVDLWAQNEIKKGVAKADIDRIVEIWKSATNGK